MRTGRPGYHPAVLLELFICGYLNRIPSSRWLEREEGRNVEVIWLIGNIPPAETAEQLQLALETSEIVPAAMTARLRLPNNEEKDKPKRRLIPDHIPRTAARRRCRCQCRLRWTMPSVAMPPRRCYLRR